jgi:hypothetical protein
VFVDISCPITKERLESGTAPLSVLQSVIEHYMKTGEEKYVDALDKAIRFIWEDMREKAKHE